MTRADAARALGADRAQIEAALGRNRITLPLTHVLPLLNQFLLPASEMLR